MCSVKIMRRFVSLLLANVDDCIRYVRLFTSHLHLFKRINNPTVPRGDILRRLDPRFESTFPASRHEEERARKSTVRQEGRTI